MCPNQQHINAWKLFIVHDSLIQVTCNSAGAFPEMLTVWAQVGSPRGLTDSLGHEVKFVNSLLKCGDNQLHCIAALEELITIPVPIEMPQQLALGKYS